MLQNEKYISFANDNAVEVVTMPGVKEAVEGGKDKRAETYDGKDEDGKPVKYLKEFAGMTLEQLEGLNGSPAAGFNNTGGIPFVAIVDPFTLKPLKTLPGGAAAGGLIDAITEAKKQLNSTHGPSLKRSVLQKFDAAAKEIDSGLAKGGVAKALTDYRKLEASVAKESDAFKARVKKLEETILAAAGAQLDDAEAKIGAGDLKAAGTVLGPLAKALKGTDLEKRANELLAKSRPAEK